MRKYRLALLLVSFTAQLGFSQSNTGLRIDSLEKQLQLSSSDTARIKIYHQLAEALPGNQPERALAFEEKALSLARKTNSPKELAEIYTRLGSIHRRQSNYYKAIDLYRKAIKSAVGPFADYLGTTYLELGIAYLRIAKLDSSRLSLLNALKVNGASGNLQTEAAVYNMLGNVLKEENNYKEALEYYLKSTAMAEKSGDQDALTQSISNVGNIEFLLGNYGKAEDYAMQSLRIATAIDKKSSMAYSDRLLGRIYRKQMKLKEALKVYFSALKIYTELGAKRDIGETHINTGNIYYEMEDFRQAAAHYFAALEIQKTLPDSANMAYSFTNIGSAYYAMKKYDRAVLYLDSARSLALRMKIPTLVMDVYGTLSDIYSEQNNYRLAFENRNRFSELKDSLEDLRNKEASAELEAKYQSVKKENEIRNLNSQNEIKALQLQQRGNERNYLVAFAILSLALVGLLYSRYQTKLRTTRKLEELDAIKSRFFANISHEFRTPLSLILGPLKKKLAMSRDDEEKEDLEMMQRNAERLHILINQLLDISKIEAGSMKLQVAEGDITKFLKIVFSSFSSLAQEKKIEYVLEAGDMPLWGFFDRDKLEKIIYNLIANAFKFTPEQGRIAISASILGNHLSVCVGDSGIGISGDKLNSIFDRFYQVDDSATRSGEGTGIGLALSKELAELHHGKLNVQSQAGAGSEFTLIIPVAETYYRSEELAPLRTEGQDPVSTAWLREVNAVMPDEALMSEGKPIVLVAEDNADMRQFISQSLGNEYHVVGALDGQDALQKAFDLIPDLIISDLMMPRLDGRAFCERIKVTEVTSHIPVILLTARADRDSKIEGLQTGADDYLTKPFDARELTVRVANLIEQRKQLRKLFRQEITLAPRDVVLAPPDTVFLKKVTVILEKKYGNHDFDVEQFSREIGMSRMQLHRKLKALSDKTPGELIREFRLERAKQLLRVNGLQVSEVAYQVGFNNLSNFTKIFKEFTGATPSEFAAQSR